MPQAPDNPTDSISDQVPDRRSLRFKTRYRSPDELIASQIRIKKPSKRQIEHLIQALRRFGCVLPILVDEHSQIVVGHAVVAAARLAGFDKVPTYDILHLTPDEIRTARLSINNIETMSGLDEDAVYHEIFHIQQISPDLVTFTGFDSPRIDQILDRPMVEDNDDASPALGTVAVSRLGDIWTFKGSHRLGCFDALEVASYDALMAGELARVAIVDAPYNRKPKSITRRADARDFPMASGELSVEEFISFIRKFMVRLKEACVDGALLLLWMDWQHMYEMQQAGRAEDLALKNLIVWSKTNPGMGSLYRAAHELCFMWKIGDAPHVNRVELGRNGRNRSNVWDYQGANSFSSPDDRQGRAHLTPKNLAMIKDAILDLSEPNDIVLDCFLGSGTTLLAAHRARRRGYGLEMDPLFVDLAVRRMEARTKAPARHEATGLTFAEMAAHRAAEPRLRQRVR